MDFIRYFGFFFKLTKGRIILFFISVLASAFFQMLAAAFFLPVFELGKTEKTDTFLTKYIYIFLDYMNLQDTNNILAFLLTTAAVSLFASSIMLVITTVYSTKIQAQILVDIQAKALEDLFKADYSYFLSQNVGFLNNIIIQQIHQVAQSFKFYGTIFVSVIFAGLYGAIPFLMKPKLSAIMIVMGLPFMILLYYINKKTKKFSMDSVEQYSFLNGLIIQSINNFKYLKSTCTYSAVIKKIEKISRKLGSIMKWTAFWGSISTYGITPFAVSLIFILVYWEVTVVKTPVIDAMAILAFLYGASQKILTVPSAYQKFIGSFGAIANYKLFLDEVLAHDEKVSGKDTLNPDFSGKLVFHEVSFKYPSGKDDVLKDINLEIQPNTSIAFVGGSGSGKSTIINMISGILKPVKGHISLSDTEYRKLNLFSLRSRIGYVTQEPVVFNDTVKNNLTLWEKNADYDNMLEAGKRARLDAFVDQMPQKYDSVLGDSGINISGGQRQRISIARELYRDTKFIILDEATSSLDSETEQLIQQSIDEFSGKKTIIIVAHRLSTIKNCNRIYVLDSGKIIEQGSYEELYKMRGKFTEMVDRQSL